MKISDVKLQHFLTLFLGKKLVTIIAIVAVIGFLVVGIIIFLACRYCRKRRASLTPVIRRGSDLIDGGLKRISTLGSRYNQVPSSSEEKENNTASLTIPDNCDNVSGIKKTIFTDLVTIYVPVI